MESIHATPIWQKSAAAQFCVADRVLAGDTTTRLPKGIAADEYHELDALVQTLEFENGSAPGLDLELEQILDDLIATKNE